MNENWEIRAKPFFSKAHCPKHNNPMEELQNGWFGNPKWWCYECEYVYELEFRKMRNYNKEVVQEQLEAIRLKKEKKSKT